MTFTVQKILVNRCSVSVEMAAEKLRNILGSMEFGRRNLTVDAPVCGHDTLDFMVCINLD